MQILRTLVIGFIATAITLPELTVAEESPVAATGAELREVVVSHTDEKGILQLYRMKEDGSDRRQLTNSGRGCRMPACSPDGKKLTYVQQVDHGLSLWISDVDGKNARALVDEGMNLIPSWVALRLATPRYCLTQGLFGLIRQWAQEWNSRLLWPGWPPSLRNHC